MLMASRPRNDNDDVDGIISIGKAAREGAAVAAGKAVITTGAPKLQSVTNIF